MLMESTAGRSRRAWESISRPLLDHLVESALSEDVGSGDITTALTIAANARARARFVMKSAGTLAGVRLAPRVFQALDPNSRWEPRCKDGQSVNPGSVVLEGEGSAAAILTAERVALNFIQRMSGVATTTSRFVQAVEGTGARILDTRKTVPGLRVLDKYAVVCGGGYNHRFGLYDGILIKDNHIVAAGGIPEALRRVREERPHTLKIEVEVDRLEQIEPALEGGADIILLDNMASDELRQAVTVVDGRALTEASGGVTAESVRSIAETGVDFISVGQLTHSSPALDISLELEL